MTVIAVLLVPGAALAANEPVLQSTHPEADGTARSTDLVVTAKYDRDLSAIGSSATLRDGTGATVSGTTSLDGPQSSSGGRRWISFRPAAPLSATRNPYRAVFEAAAVGGETTETAFSFDIDDTSPPPPVIEQPATGTVHRGYPVYATGRAENGATVEVRERENVIATGVATSLGAFSIRLPYPPEDGVVHTIDAVAMDRAGNRSMPSAASAFRHDTVTIVPVITWPAEAVVLADATVVVTGRAKPSATVTIWEAGTPIGSSNADASGAWSTPITFATGHHSITATSWDGYTTDGPSAARAFTIDPDAPPAPVVERPREGEVVTTADVLVRGTADPADVVEIRENGLLRGAFNAAANRGWSGYVRFTDGPHTIVVGAVDAAGNRSLTATRSFTVDTVPPPAPLIETPAARSFHNTNVVLVSGTAEESSTVRIRESGATIGTTTASATGAWGLSLTFAEGSHTITALSVDAAGHVGAESLIRSFTIDTVAPATPVITSPLEGAIVRSATVTVRGTAEQGSTVTVAAGEDVIGTGVTASDGSWSVQSTFAEGEHAVTARTTDRAGNSSGTSTPRSFTVDLSGDTSAPAPPTLSTPREDSLQRPFVLFSGTAEAGATVRVIGDGELASGTAEPNGQFSFGAYLTPGSHRVYATATDRAGNTSQPSATRSFSVDGERPRVTIATADTSIFVPLLPEDEVRVTGTASDDTAVVAVTVEYATLTGEVVATHEAFCDVCPAADVTWESEPPLPPGIYRVRATAADGVGARSATAQIHIIVLV